MGTGRPKMQANRQWLTNWLRLDACTLRFNQALPEGVITKKCAFGLLTVGEYTDCPRADAR
jgi:hypothetical protein